jgi:hypothetical protein
LTVEATSVTGNHAAEPGGGGGIMNIGLAVGCSGGSTVRGNTAGDPPAANNCVGAGCATCPA